MLISLRSADGAPEQRDAVIWSYRLFLDRDPESDQAVANLRHADSTMELRRIFLSSAEYRSREAGFGAMPDTVALSHPAARVDVNPSADAAERLRQHVERTWTKLGNEAPHWSVLSDDAFRPERIADTEASFYASGEADAQLVDAILARHGLKPADLPHCFEFGCGLGRVTVPLARRFAQVTGCDISASHLAGAQRHISGLDLSNVELVHATAHDLGMQQPFDLWFSRIVLQHNPPPVIARVLRRAFVLLKPGGVAIFQVPTWAQGYSFDIETYLRDIGELDGVEMHCIPQTEVFAAAADAGLVTLEVREEFSAGPPMYWLSNIFVFRRVA